MQITIHRYGGFAGTQEVNTVETGDLSAAQQKSIGEALDRLRKLSKEHNPVGADYIRYEIVVADPKGQQIISFSDDGSEKAQELIKLVTAISAGAKPKKDAPK